MKLDILHIIFFTPIICAVLSLYTRSITRLVINLISSSVLSFSSVILYKNFISNNVKPFFIIKDMLPNISLVLNPDNMSIIFIMLISFLLIPAVFYSHSYMQKHCDKDEKLLSRFFAFFSLAIASVMGVALAGNLWSLFIFYELLTVSTYPLVTFDRKEINLDSGKIYIHILMGTSISLLMPAIIIIWQIKGSTLLFDADLKINNVDYVTYITIFIMTIYGCSKSALFPFSLWLPKAMTAPTPVSALLHAVAVVKAGVFSIMKITYYTFDLNQYNVKMILIVASAITIVFASIEALRKKEIKAILAYSTISQLSYILITFACFGKRSLAIAMLYMILHSLAKITLFFATGAIYIKTGYKHVKEVKGLIKKMPITCLVFSFATLAIIGIPPLATIWGKYMILSSSSSEILIIATVIGFSTVMSTLYLFPIVYNLLFATNKTPYIFDEAPIMMLIPYIITCLILIIMYAYPSIMNYIIYFILNN